MKLEQAARALFLKEFVSATWLALKYFNQSAIDLLNLSQINVALPNLGARDTLKLVALATLLGWLGAYVSVQSHLRRGP